MKKLGVLLFSLLCLLLTACGAPQEETVPKEVSVLLEAVFAGF